MVGALMSLATGRGKWSETHVQGTGMSTPEIEGNLQKELNCSGSGRQEYRQQQWAIQHTGEQMMPGDTVVI